MPQAPLNSGFAGLRNFKNLNKAIAKFKQRGVVTAMKQETTYGKKVHFETKKYSVLDKASGEITERSFIEKVISPDLIDIGFVKLWKGYLTEFLNNCNRQDCKILAFLLSNTNRSNCIEITQREIAKLLGLSLPTVNKSLARLKNLNIIRNSRKFIMLNPNFIAYGKYKTRSKLLEIYEKL